MRRHHAYRKFFLEINGPGPWPCYGCGKPATADRFVVHHVDDDFTNNTKRNLKPMHDGCHARLHHKGRINTPESREKMRQAALRRYKDPEQRRLSTEINLRRNGPEFSAKMSEAAKRTYEDPERRRANAEHLRAVSNTEEERKRRSERAKRMWKEGKLGRKKQS